MTNISFNPPCSGFLAACMTWVLLLPCGAGFSQSDISDPPSFPSPVMVTVPGGEFEMGDVIGDNKRGSERPRRVQLDSFQLGAYEVTFEEYEAFCSATKRERPFDHDYGRGRHPVINVSWLDAVAYCNWLSLQQGLRPVYTIEGGAVSADWRADGFRLPTEAEWEYAAREGGKKVRFGNGKDIANPSMINFEGHPSLQTSYSMAGESRNRPLPVGSFAPNSLGLFDMSGNVWEWCWDRSAPYPREAQVNPRGPDTGVFRVRRGGSWNNNPQTIRTANRSEDSPSSRSRYIGFRVARSLN